MIQSEIKISSEFKTQTKKTIVAIVFFVFIYLLILLLAVGLTALCIYGGVMLIVLRPMFLTFAFGIGIGSLGILILLFLIKFIFSKNKVDLSHLHEVKRIDEPELFKLIDEIVTEVGTSFPKKVYLSSEVNAAVFYNSSFWSMFFPIKKNLQIGLGLINTVTKSELKAILAHEFGHFSQKTMKVGSYVYNVNKVIFNMIYDNSSYEKLIQNWANVSGYFFIFVLLAVKIIEGIKWILRKLYDVVNLTYMGLSREMEFHADEIAANVTGFEPLKSSLLRMTLADHSYNSVLSFYDVKIKDNVRSQNIYKEQFYVMNLLANDMNIPIVNNIPAVASEELNKFNKSKLNIKDQWASHPSTDERVIKLEQTNLSSVQLENTSASNLFKDMEQMQKEFTNRIFKDIEFQGEALKLSLEDFQTEFKQSFIDNSFSKIYNGYYDNKNPIPFEINGPSSIHEGSTLDFLFGDDKVDLAYTSIALQNDIETLKMISDKTISVKTFDYDGEKYRRKASKELIPKLVLELEEINKQIKLNDSRIFDFFRKLELSKNSHSQLEILYNEFFKFDIEFESNYEIFTNMSVALQFVNYATPIEEIMINFRKVKPMEENLKKEIKKLLSEPMYVNEINKEIKDNFELYLSKNWEYSGINIYYNDHLNILFTAMNNYAFILSRGYFLLKKKLLNYQEELIKNNSQEESVLVVDEIQN